MNPILLDVPLQIETDRLILRAPLQAGEGNVVHEVIKDSIRELKPWLSLFQSIPTVEETEILLRNAHIDFLKRESFRYLIYHKETNDFVGTASLHRIDWKVSKCEIGYWINTQFSGSGYMTETVSALTNLGFQLFKFRRIEIRCECNNTKSRALPEKLGFELEGILRNEDFSSDGKQLTDTCIYAKIK
ncbi:GNAT family N-acetyltransferase [Bacillus thuringiensis]|uniref:GNAT family N-acetyltransferase n=1 Tax=Bacillus thuringiensis TaxID=1428 RepID=A0A9W3TGS3_BACTU|nr:GNAT family N-acetyltransferase [Bacillus thuringiensis]AQY41423.1 GNAT family N-acetyltransferase [Bacillus thuringiensis]MDR4145587.1 GNAT family N-acetyltransferase [Bacillus thuringiensis]MEC3574358.1 GNAT family N-acetyltransferase [Bacillus thuringiensis]MED2020728.1 GNAT family N-acetyltransferase [Bacillus thuringiensis]MED2141016.1 GNAT family N-acetyltransferase [Bacillus thuringiensis]